MDKQINMNPGDNEILIHVACIIRDSIKNIWVALLEALFADL